MESKNPNTRKIGEEINPIKKRKHIPNLPLLPRVNVKLEPLYILDDLGGGDLNKKPGRKNIGSTKTSKLSKKSHPNVKIMSTKGLFSDGFQSELKTDSKPEVSLTKSTRKITTRSSAKDDQIKQEKTNLNTIEHIIEEPKVWIRTNKNSIELANIIQEYGEYFPVALPLTTKLNAIIHETDTNENIEDEKSFIKTEGDFKSTNESNYSECFSLLMDDSTTYSNSNNDYFLFQIPASYSTILNKNIGHVDSAMNKNMNSEDEFDFNGNNIENPYFTSEEDASNSVGGFLELTESGQVRLRIGSEIFDVDDAIKNCFLQELYVTESDPSIDDDPIIAQVGRIANKFVCTWSLEDN